MSPNSRGHDRVPSGQDLSCRRLASQLTRGLVTQDEFNANFTWNVVSLPAEAAPQAVDMIPAPVLGEYFDFLRAELEPVDFMPSPAVFLVDTSCEAAAERKRRELRPKYVRLYDLVRDRLAGGAGAATGLAADAP